MTSGVVRGSPRLLYSQQLANVFDESGLKVTTLITEDSFGQALVDKETVPQSLGHCPFLLISGKNSDGVLCKMVGYDQDVLCSMSIGFQGQVVNAD